MKEATKLRVGVREVTKEWSTEKTVVIDRIPTIHSYARVLVGGAMTKEMSVTRNASSVEFTPKKYASKLEPAAIVRDRLKINLAPEAVAKKYGTLERH